jgi:hypothetical protein
MGSNFTGALLTGLGESISNFLIPFDAFGTAANGAAAARATLGFFGADFSDSGCASPNSVLKIFLSMLDDID